MAEAGTAYRFGSFLLLPDRRALLAQGEDVQLRGRAFDLLLALVEQRDRVVTKDELMAAVWAGRIVEEGNLTVHVAALRRLLGSGVIATISGRGYRFVAPVELDPAEPAPLLRPDPPSTPPEPVAPPRAAPRPLTRLVGRDADLDRVVAQFGQHRLVTVVGPGGIGKSRLALAAADLLRGRYPDGVWIAEFGPLDDPALLPDVIAAALGIQMRGGETSRAIALALAGRRALLVLDGCEHLLGATAGAAEAILGACPDMAILATSREPLRAEGERLHRLGPLGTAAPLTPLTAAELAAWPAAELFLERAGAVLGDILPSDAEAARIMAICRRLDGIPLAIELAAAMLQVLGIADLQARIEARFDLLTSGRRTALPRQQTLRATIGWSFDLLAPEELQLLLRLSVFAGGWTSEAASFVVGRGTGEDEVLRLTAALVDKSLVQADLTQRQPRYGMLDVTRYYATERTPPRLLAEARHGLALWLTRIYERAEADWPFTPDDVWSELYAPDIGNLRAGLAWAFGPDGDVALGIRLASFSEHVWSELSQASELQRWFDTALSKLDEATPPDVAGRLWLGRCGWLALGDPRALAAARQAVALFRHSGSRIDLGRALWRHAHQLLATGQLDAAEPLLAEAEPMLREIRESKALVSWLRVAALARARRAAFREALDNLAEALEIARRLGSPRDIALTLADSAETCFAMGDIDAAIRIARDALDSLGAQRRQTSWMRVIAGALGGYLLAAGAVAEAKAGVTERLHTALVMGPERELVREIERFGLIAAQEEMVEIGALCLGHSHAYHDTTKLLRGFSAQHVVGRLEQRLRHVLPDAEFGRLAAEGARATAEQLLQRAGLPAFG